MSWTVVEFLETNTVEAVPTRWISSNRCYWPSFSSRSKIIAEIKNNVLPDPEWPTYAVRSFKDGTYGKINSFLKYWNLL